MLADGYLVCGDLSPQWIHFLLGYGILLQLADDLQDLYTDAASKHWTLFSIYYQHKTVDSQVQKLRNFSHEVFKTFPGDWSASNKVLIEVMRKAVDYLIFDAASMSRRVVSEVIWKDLKSSSPSMSDSRKN